MNICHSSCHERGRQNPITIMMSRKADTCREEKQALKVARAVSEQHGQGHLIPYEKQIKGPDGTVADAQTYDEYEKSFEKVLKDLEQDSSLDNFRSQYEKVLQTVRKSHDNEKRLAVKCKQLNNELVGAAARVTAALRLSEEDQITIATLRKELEKTWKQIDSAHDKENDLRSQLAALRLEFEDMARQAEENKEHDAAIDDLLRHKEELLQERDNQMTEILTMRQERDHLTEQLKDTEAQKDAVEATLQAVRTEAAAKKAERERDAKKREKLEKEVHDLKMCVEARQVELRTKVAEALSAENMLRDYEHQVGDLHAAANRINKEHNDLVNHSNRLQRELDAQITICSQLAVDNQGRAAALKTAEASLTAAKAENMRLSRAAESATAKLRAAKERQDALEQTRDKLKTDVSSLERERNAGERRCTLLESKVASMQHEEDVLAKLRAQAEGSTHQQMDLVKVHEGHMRVVEGELAAHKAAAHQAAQQEAALVREHEALALQAKTLSTKLAEAHEELERKDKEMAEVQAMVEERKATVAGQQKAYEKVRAERNRYSHQLIAAEAEVAHAKRRFAQVGHQVELLREDLKTKEAALMKERFTHSKIDGERQMLLTELANAQKAAATRQKDSTAMETELLRMSEVVAQADQERARQRKEYEALIAERDVLGTQLVRRNDEVALLYGKLQLQTSALQAGQMAYRDRLAELRLVKARVGALQRDLAAAQRVGMAAGDLKREVLFLNKKLLHEQAKSKALSEELETPLNVHRWRKLEGSDASMYELIQKVQLLQRRLIRASERLVEKDLQVREREQLVRSLGALAKRNPGPDASRKLSLTQAGLREKAKQLQALRGELDMRHAQVDDYKMSIRQMQTEIDALKGHFFIQKSAYMQGTGQAPSSSEASVLIEEVFETPQERSGSHLANVAA